MIVLANDERGSTDTSRLDFSNDDLSCRLKTERAINRRWRKVANHVDSKVVACLPVSKTG